MEIRRVSIEKLNPAAYNPRKDLRPGDPEYQRLEQSMERYGYVEPIVWNERTGNVVGGHQRLKILIATGAKETDVSVVDLSPTDEKALNVALNKIDGAWDDDRLTAVLQELSSEIDLSITGFGQNELDDLFAPLTTSERNFALHGMEQYMDSFFESGAQEKPSRKQKVDCPHADAAVQEDAQKLWNITVFDMTESDADALEQYLTERGYTYQRGDAA